MDDLLLRDVCLSVDGDAHARRPAIFGQRQHQLTERVARAVGRTVDRQQVVTRRLVVHHRGKTRGATVGSHRLHREHLLQWLAAVEPAQDVGGMAELRLLQLRVVRHELCLFRVDLTGNAGTVEQLAVGPSLLAGDGDRRGSIACG